MGGKKKSVRHRGVRAKERLIDEESVQFCQVFR